MRKRLFIAAFIFLVSCLVMGQTSVVSGTILDPSGNPYQNGSGLIVLVPQNQNFLVNGTNPVPSPIPISGLDSFGHFSTTLYNTNIMSPSSANPQWQFSFCSQSINGLQPVCFTMSAIPITGNTDISALAQSQSAPLPSSGGGGGSSFAVVTNPALASTNSIVPTVNNIPGLTQKCAAGSAANQIAYQITNSGGGNIFSVTCGGIVTVLSGMGGSVTAGDLYGTLQSVPFSASETFNAAGTMAFKTTLTGNVTSSSLINIPSNAFGKEIAWIICQDGVGGRTFTWPANVINPPVVPTTASQCNGYIGVTDGVNAYIQGSGTAGSGIAGTLTINTIPKASSTGSNPPVQNSTITESGSPLNVSVPRLEKVRYTDQFNWAAQSPAVTLTAGVQATVTLTPCPVGIDTSGDLHLGVGSTASGANNLGGYWLHISDSALSEDFPVTGGTCTSGAGSGTIIFTPANSHTNSSGWTISSGSIGIQEAINDGCGASTTPVNNYGCHIIIPPSVTPYTITGRIFFHAQQSVLEGRGATLACASSPNGSYRGPCLQIGDQNVSTDYRGNHVDGLTFVSPASYSTNPAYNGCLISSTQRAGGLITITTASACGFKTGDAVTIMWTDNPAYWGDVPYITVTSSTTFTYPRSGVADITLQTTPGTVAITYVPILDNSSFTMFTNIRGSELGQLGTFTNFFDFWDDEEAEVFDFDNGATKMTQGANWVGSNIFSGGQANIPNHSQNLASVISVFGANITAQNSTCGTVLNSNGVYIHDTICQASGVWQWNVQNTAGNFQGGNFWNVYPETSVGGNLASPASSPWPGTGVGGLFCKAGSGNCTYKGAFAPTSAIQTAGAGGGSTFYYFLTVHDTSTSAVIAPILVYQWNSTGSDAPVIPWPRWANSADGITYTLIRTTVNPLNGANSVFPTLSACTGGSPTACGTVTGAVGLAQCAGFVCSFTDSATANTVAATANDIPLVSTWPAAAPLAFMGPVAYGTISVPLIADQEPIGQVVQAGTLGNPTYVAMACNNAFGLPGTGGGWSQCFNSHSTIVAQTATILSDGGTSGGVYPSITKGRLIFGGTTINDSPHHIITLVDSVPDVTRATGRYRPTASSTDTYIGIDQSTGGGAKTHDGLSIGAPLSISEYIGNIGDNISFLSRLTSTQQQFTVPVSSPTFSTVPTYHIDGVTYTTMCNTIQNVIPNNTAAVVYEDILETNIPCDPFSQTRTIKLVLNTFNANYTTNVPWHMSSHEMLVGATVPGTIGTTVTGVSIQPSATYSSTNNPYVSVVPSGFNLATTACASNQLTGNYWIGLTWSANGTNETNEGQQTQLTFAGNCLLVTPPGSLPVGATNVTTYNIYMCNVASCAQGVESFKKQSAIGTPQTITSANIVVGLGNPPAFNNTGAIITLGGGSGVNTPAGGVPGFGIRVENIYIDCNNVAGAIAGVNLQGEEHSGFFNSEAKNCPGVAGFMAEGYSLGTGASNSEMTNLAVDTGMTSNPTVAGIIFDQLAPYRGFDKITVTGGTQTSLALNNGTMTSGSAVLTSASNPFTLGMVGQGVVVEGAGINGVRLTSTIVTFTNSGSVTLATNASTSVTTSNVTVYPTPYCMLINDVVSGPPGGTGIYNSHFEKCANGIHLVDSQVFASNITCSPNVGHCIDIDPTSSPSEFHNVRQGTPGITIYDSAINYTSPRSFEGSYGNFTIVGAYRDVGPIPTCSSSDLGTGGTCTIAPGGVNNSGKMNLTIGTGGSNLNINVTLTYGGAQGLGDDSSSCAFTPVSGNTAWQDGTTWRATATGTGSSVVRLTNGGLVGQTTLASNGSISSGAAILTSTSNPFTAAQVGQGITVGGAGTAGGLLTSTIQSFQNPGQVTLSSNASTTTTGTSVIILTNAFASGNTVGIEYVCRGN